MFLLLCIIVINLIGPSYLKQVTNARSFTPNNDDVLPDNGFLAFPIKEQAYSNYISWSGPLEYQYVVKYIDQPGITIKPGSTMKYSGQAAFHDFDFEGNGNKKLNYSIKAIKDYKTSKEIIITNRDNACFPKGSKVALLNCHKNIEDIQIGDTVVGAFGEHNTVIGFQQVYVGENKLFNINEKHITTDHHPHITPTKSFVICTDINKLDELYNKEHQIFDGTRNVMRLLTGLNKSRMSILKINDTLKTLNGETIVKSIKPVEMDKDNILYNLVVSGSHTYHVDDFAVTGWPSENDFNYSSWTLI